MIETIGVLGGGAWGTALALTAARAGRKVRLWARDAETVAAIDERGENPRYLPGVALEHVPATTSIAVALRADAVLLAVPAQTVRAVTAVAAPYLADGIPLVICAKGLERGTAKRLSEVVAEAAPRAVPAVLSGPSFAADVARRLPTAVTIAAADGALALDLCRALASATFRPYAETDVIGVEIGGAVKNVLAIAAGIVAGRKLGASAVAAITTRGFAELRRLGEALGARPETLMGLSGLGDLVLTCFGRAVAELCLWRRHRRGPRPLGDARAGRGNRDRRRRPRPRPAQPRRDADRRSGRRDPCRQARRRCRDRRC